VSFEIGNLRYPLKSMALNGNSLTFWVAMVILCAPPLYLGVSTTGALEWPLDIDLFRDIAQAQTIADGAALDDPFYLGERIWYNPLVSTIVAAGSFLSELPVPKLYTTMGAWLNLLIPISFALLVRGLFGGIAAVAATFDFLYLRNSADPSWASATYSPWLYASSVAQIGFYAAAFLYWRALERPQINRFILPGVLFGLVFLAHTAPAVVMIGTFLVISTIRLVQSNRSDRRKIIAGITLASGVAILIASPFLFSIIWHYGLQVQNPVPMQWTWTLARDLEGLASQVGWETGVSLAVLAIWLAAAVRTAAPRGSMLVIAWLLTACLILAYDFFGAPRGLPMIVPRHHSLLYIKAAESVLVGWAVARAFEVWPGTKFSRPRAAFALAFVALAVALALPSYRQRDAFLPEKQAATKRTNRPFQVEAYEWLRQHTGRDDVVLASNDVALTVVGTAGVKTVAVHSAFSNPYVSWKPRVFAQEAMFEALERGDFASFRSRAARYNVSYVLRVKTDGEWLPDQELPELERVFTNQQIRIHRVQAGR